MCSVCNAVTPVLPTFLVCYLVIVHIGILAMVICHFSVLDDFCSCCAFIYHVPCCYPCLEQIDVCLD